MTNTFYTTTIKTCHCPLWNVDVKVKAKYRYFKSNDNIATFTGLSECDILKNLRSPKSKQNADFEMYHYCDRDDTCRHLTDFPEKIKLH